MPITDQYQRLPIDQIEVARDDRQRKEIDVSDIIDSIRERGIFNPLIVHRPEGANALARLVAGERRLTAARQLGHPDVPVRFAEDLSGIELQIFELEENIKRKDLTWKEIVQSVAKIHSLYEADVPSWTITETAQRLGLSIGIVSMYLTVMRSWEDPKVQASDTVREAYNMLRRREQREAGDALEELLGMGAQAPQPAEAQGSQPVVAPQPGAVAQLTSPAFGPAIAIPQAMPLALDPARSILHESFLHWAPGYSGPKFNLIHCDFPYGINVFAGPQGSKEHFAQGGAYDDSKDLYFALLDCLLTNLDRLMSISGHLVFWYSERYGPQTRQLFAERAPSLVIHTHPLIWFKTDNTGIASDANRTPRHVYETALLGIRGGRNLVRIAGDAYGAPVDRKFHPSTKPEPMLKHFFQMLVDENTRLLDPTAGSGSALRAAEALGASQVLGLENDEAMAGTARMLLRQARTLRRSGL